MNFASGSQLAQVRPSGTTATLAYTPTIRTEITAIFVANTTGSAAAFSIYHDDDGSTYDATTALYEAVQVPANTTTVIRSEGVGSGICVSTGGKVAVKSGTGNALTFTFYGVTASLTGK